MNPRAPFPARDASVTLPDPEQHLEHTLAETRKAFEEGRIEDGIAGLGHAIAVASKRQHMLSDAEVTVLVNRTTSAGIEAVREAW